MAFQQSDTVERGPEALGESVAEAGNKNTSLIRKDDSVDSKEVEHQDDSNEFALSLPYWEKEEVGEESHPEPEIDHAPPGVLSLDPIDPETDKTEDDTGTMPMASIELTDMEEAKEEEIELDQAFAENNPDVFDNKMPGFRAVEDSEGMFTSRSDYFIFNSHLQSQIPLQRLVAVKQLAESCKRFGRKAALSIVPKLEAVAKDSEMVIRQTTAENFGAFAEYLWHSDEQTDMAHKVIIDTILPHIQHMLTKDTMEVRQAAGRSLIQIAQLLNQDDVHEHVLKIPLLMAHDPQDDHKITALPLIGKLAPIVGQAVCRNYLSRDLLALSQDNSFRVRKATVQYFGPICEQLGSDCTEEQLLPIFKKLCKDNIWSVRKGCVESLIDISRAISQEKRTELIDVMRAFLGDSSRWVRNTAYEMLGRFISTLTSEQVKPEFLRFYTNIPQLKTTEADTESSNHCAFCFPGVLKTLGSDRWDELVDTYTILVRKTFKTRKTLAYSLHECAKILKTEKTEMDLIPALDIFLKDIDAIREGVVKSFAQFLEILSPEKREEHLANLWELASEVDTNWRFRLYLAQQLDTLASIYSPETISEQIVPLLFQLCDDKMNAVRVEAASKLPKVAMHLLENGTDSQFEDILRKWLQISSNRTYARRILFIYSCEACLDVFPNYLFKRRLLKEMCAKHKDKISNVRLVLARVLQRSFLGRDDFKDNDELLATVESLRAEKEDIDIIRIFGTKEEVEAWQKSQELVDRNLLLEEKEEYESSSSEASANLPLNDERSY